MDKALAIMLVSALFTTLAYLTLKHHIADGWAHVQAWRKERQRQRRLDEIGTHASPEPLGTRGGVPLDEWTRR